MKILSILFALLLSISLFSQDPSDRQITSGVEVSSDRVIQDATTNELQLIGNATFVSEELEITNADKIIYNSKTKKVIAEGMISFDFSGAVIVADTKNVSRLVHTLGEDSAYLK